MIAKTMMNDVTTTFVAEMFTVIVCPRSKAATGIKSDSTN